MKTALIIVDVQNDYIKDNGLIHIPYSINIIDNINNIKDNFDIICFTKNISEKNTLIKNITDIRISDNGFFCVKDTNGSEIHDKLSTTDNNVFIRNYNESFSGLLGKNSNNMTLLEYLQNNNITHTFVCGLPGDYSVKYTVIDLLKYFKTYLILDATRTLGKLNNLIYVLIKNKIPIITTNRIKRFLKQLNTTKKYYINKNLDFIHKIKSPHSKRKNSYFKF